VQQYYVNDSASIAVQNGALLVASAGNNATPSGGGASPILSNLETIDEIRGANLVNGPGAFIVVGAVSQSNQIAFFSNRAGTARDFYMVAPGVSITVPYNGQIQNVDGTSASAPLVAGAAAVVLQRWPHLTARQLADVLFASATDLGAPGVDDVYGHGLLNLTAALQPIGTTTLAVQNGASQPSSSALFLGPAFGDAPGLRTAMSHVMTLDGFGRDFATDLSARVAPVRQDFVVPGLLRQRLDWQGAQAGGSAASFSLGFQDARWRIAAQNGLESEQPHNAVVQLNGRTQEFSWSFGTGQSLHDLLSDRSGASPLSLSGAFSDDVARPGTSAALRTRLTPGTDVTLGISHMRDAARMPASFGESDAIRADAAALRVDTFEFGAQFAVELGAMIERGSVLGSRSAGGLAFGQTAATLWSTVDVDAPLGEIWSLHASSTLAFTDAGARVGSLISTLQPVVASSFSLGLLRRDALLYGDTLSFTLHQKLRAEDGRVTLVSGDHLDPAGRVVFVPEQVSLAPSGRELAFEAGYRVTAGTWIAEASIAYRRDAGHIDGRHDAAGMIALLRRF
jgi:hypothetical protein